LDQAVPPLIRVANLGKRFGAVIVLDTVSVEVRSGGLALLGANGAGKFLLRIVIPCCAPAGAATVMASIA
jgi:ABC-type sugar transport system ATPase subunit